MKYPFRLYEGREKYYISMTYETYEKSEYKCQGWGVVTSDCIFSLGDKLISYRFLTSEKSIKTKNDKSDLKYYFSKKRLFKPIDYYFIDFICESESKEKGVKKILKASLDVKECYVKKRSILPLILVSNNDLIIGKGDINFEDNSISLETFESCSFRILGFFS